ncbi:unnamed protein product [Enterobius vermicularis]|uniref:Uncharacterized protein n=1 Tax=Enterobius vermicularis TaxID=51028 RepID=A0A0N4VAB3_ENTVE|nr:unnamed protein product [Enterobius vermicularis]
MMSGGCDDDDDDDDDDDGDGGGGFGAGDIYVVIHLEKGVNMYYTQMLMKLRCIDVQSGVDDNDDDDDDDVDVDDGIGKDIY